MLFLPKEYQIPESQKVWREANELWEAADVLTDRAIYKLREGRISQVVYYGMMMVSVELQQDAAELDKAAGFILNYENSLREVN